jgi:hypothetical protein
MGRWHYCLDPNIKSGGWTAHEDRTILQLQRKHGNEWSRIAKRLPGRTGYAVRNRFNCIMKRTLRFNAAQRAAAGMTPAGDCPDELRAKRARPLYDHPTLNGRGLAFLDARGRCPDPPLPVEHDRGTHTHDRPGHGHGQGQSSSSWAVRSFWLTRRCEGS